MFTYTLCTEACSGRFSARRNHYRRIQKFRRGLQFNYFASVFSHVPTLKIQSEPTASSVTLQTFHLACVSSPPRFPLRKETFPDTCSPCNFDLFTNFRLALFYPCFLSSRLSEYYAFLIYLLRAPVLSSFRPSYWSPATASQSTRAAATTLSHPYNCTFS